MHRLHNYQINRAILSEYIQLNLILDVGQFYRQSTISNMRYREESIAFWATVQKLFKGKRINFFRGYNGEGNVVSVDGRVLPVDCKIHFAVPSNPVLLKETSTYTNDTSHPGLLNVALDAFANENRNNEVKLSIDGKKLAIGCGEMGDEDVSGFESPPTLSERKTRISEEIKHIDNIKNFVEIKPTTSQLSLNEKNSMKIALLLSIANLSQRINELRQLVVKRKIHLENLLNLVEGDWKKSKMANALVTGKLSLYIQMIIEYDEFCMFLIIEVFNIMTPDFPYTS